MDSSQDEFGLDLANFDLRDFVPDAEGGSMFDDQSRDKARLQAQRSLMQTPSQNINNGYYGYQPVQDSNGPVSPAVHPSSLSSLSLEQLNLLLNVGLSQPGMGQDHQNSGQSSGAALANSADALKEQLAQQIKLQQLQQLQNHILQQQIQLLTAGARGMANKDVQQLLTPASTDIRSATGSTQVSPNILPPGMFHPNSGRMHTHFNPNSTMSAPASLAFNMSGQTMPQSPASDFLTPLTSPVFPPVSSHSHRGNIKRSADVFESDVNDGTGNVGGGGSRKRPAHSASFGNLNLNMGMTTVSPALLTRIPRNRRPSLGGGAMDTPSPIDLTMPPPGGPGNSGGGYMAHHPHAHPHSHMAMTGGDSEMAMPLTIQGSDRQRIPSGPPSSNTSNATATASSSTNVSPDLMPATPSLLMNMGSLNLPAGLVPPMMDAGNSIDKSHSQMAQAQPSTSRRGKNTTRSRGLSTSAVQSSSAPSTSIAGAAKTRRAAANASGRGASTGGGGGGGRTSSFGGPKVKATHKDAEQKRRDSLKTSFDELRLLLPPIPMSSSATGPLAGLGLAGDDSDEAPLPGAMPPRGPPRGEGDGPNKGVSKLVLLRCGNEFIRDLVGRVGRRDEEIELLRGEVRRLRNLMGMGMGGMSMSMPGVQEEVDVDKDLDKEDEWYREERRRARKKKLEEEEQEEGMDS